MKVQAISMGALAVHVATLLLALGLLCALSLDLATTASAQTIGCSTSDSSPSLNDAIDAVALIAGRGSCCQSNEWPFGSHCHNFQTVGGANIGICGEDSGCLPCDVASRMYFDLIETCASNAFGGSRVAGTVSHITSDFLRVEIY